MDVKEFIKLDPNKIRRDNELMQLFVKFYEAAFSVKPNCAGCVFKSGFKRLKSHVLGSKSKDLNTYTMKEKTFVIKPKFRNKILTYKKDNITFRSYGYNLTEEFSKELVNSGKNDIFIKEPVSDNQEAQQVEKKEESKFYSMDYRGEVLPLYADVKEATGLRAESKRKEDIIEFLDKYAN